MQLPTALACRNLICGTVAQTSIQRYRGTTLLPPSTLHVQPDPAQTWTSMAEWTVDDLIHYGVAYWVVLARDGVPTDRNPKGLPVRARRVDPLMVQVHYSDNLLDYDNVRGFTVNGVEMEREDVIFFQSGADGLLKAGARTFTAIADLEAAAQRMANVELPAGVLQNTGAELNNEEAQALVSAFTEARQQSSIAFLQGVEWQTSGLDSRQLQLVEARAASDTLIARMYGVPVSMVGASPTGNASAMVYANLSMQQAAMVQSAVGPYLRAIEQVLSSDSVTPHGQSISFNVGAFLRSHPEASVSYATDLLAAGVIDQAEARSFLGIAEKGDTGSTLNPGEV